MKIAFFVNYSHPVGTYFRWHNLALALIQGGHEVDVFASDHDWKTKVRSEVRDGINYHIVPSLQTVRIFYRPNDYISAIRRLFYLPQKKYDVYHLFQPFVSAYVPWKYLQKKNRQAVFLYDWDDLWTGGLLHQAKNIRESYYNKMTASLEYSIPFFSDGVTVCSDFLLKRVKNANIPIEIIGNGYWPKQVQPKAEMRKKWNLASDLFYIGYVGKTADELGWIIEAFAKIRKKGITDVRLIIVGPPQMQMDEFTAEQKINRIYLGEVTPTEAREIATGIDLGLIPLDNSLFNQSRFPIKFFDFLTVGTPIYMSDVGEIARLGKKIDEAFIGSNVKSEWEDGLAQVIKVVKSANFKVSAEKTINNYTWPSIAAKQLNFYQKLLKQKGIKKNE